MVRLTLTIERSGELEGASGRVRSARPAYAAAGMKLRQQTLQNFAMGGVYPSRWKPSARDGKTLVRTATLKNSISSQPTGSGVSVGTSVKYAGVHQFGATIAAKNAKALRFRIGSAWVTVKKVVIPARPFLPVRNGKLHPDTSDWIERVFVNWWTTGKATP